MYVFEDILSLLLFWYICGIINVAIFQAVLGDDEFKTTYRAYEDLTPRTKTLLLCYGLAPLITTVIVLICIWRLPLKLGTRLGRFIGRKISGNDF